MNRPARQVLEYLVKVEPNNPEAWHHLGTAAFLALDYIAGIAATRKALRIQPNHPRALHNLILAYMESRRYMRALAAVRLAERRLGRDAVIRRLAMRLRTTILRRSVWGFMFRTVRNVARKIRNRIFGAPKSKRSRNATFRQPTNL